jgi:hypothetical protein
MHKRNIHTSTRLFFFALIIYLLQFASASLCFILHLLLRAFVLSFLARGILSNQLNLLQFTNKRPKILITYMLLL